MKNIWWQFGKNGVSGMTWPTTWLKHDFILTIMIIGNLFGQFHTDPFIPQGDSGIEQVISFPCFLTKMVVTVFVIFWKIWVVAHALNHWLAWIRLSLSDLNLPTRALKHAHVLYVLRMVSITKNSAQFSVWHSLYVILSLITWSVQYTLHYIFNNHMPPNMRTRTVTWLVNMRRIDHM